MSKITVFLAGVVVGIVVGIVVAGREVEWEWDDEGEWVEVETTEAGSLVGVEWDARNFN